MRSSKNNPCYGCKVRYVGCPMYCEDGKRAEAERKAEREKIAKARLHDNIYYSVHSASVQKRIKYNRQHCPDKCRK